MNFADTVTRLLRRWYILLAGLLLAAGGAAAVWTRVPPTFERRAVQVLLPGNASLPDRGKNPYLYLGGLTLAADVVVRAVGSESLAHELKTSYPGTKVEVSRDPSTAGPVVLVTVTSPTDADAAAVLNMLVARTATALDSLQRAESIPSGERITVVPVTVDDQSTVKDRNRILFSAATVVAILGLSLIVAAVTEGLSGRHRARTEKPEAAAGTDDPASTSSADPRADVGSTAPTGDDLPSAEDPGSGENFGVDEAPVADTGPRADSESRTDSDSRTPERPVSAAETGAPTSPKSPDVSELPAIGTVARRSRARRRT